MSSVVCLDASVLLKLYLPEPGASAADALITSLLEDDASVIGPAFVYAEVLSVLRRQVHRGVVEPSQARVMMDSLFALPIEIVDGQDVYERAWEIAAELKMPVLYDAVYLAVAESRGAVFWTADREFFLQCGGRSGVALLGGS